MSRIKANWTHHYGWPYEGGELYPGPRSTPTWHEGHLYFSALDGSVTCLKAVDGTRVWSCNPKKTHRGQGTDRGTPRPAMRHHCRFAGAISRW